MANPELEDILQKLRQLVEAEYARGQKDAIARIMRAAGHPSATNGHITKEPGHQRDSKDRAARGSVDRLINRVLAERGDAGAGAMQIHEAATPEEQASYSGIRFALERGRDAGRYINHDGRWFLKELPRDDSR